MSWVRLWEEMTNDPKWLLVRHRASQSVTGVTVGHVISVFVHMMTNCDSHGTLVNWCDEDVAVRLEYEAAQVAAIREAMQGKVLDGNSLKSWEKRQPKREDSSTVRMQELRARRDAERHSVTQCDAPEEKRIEEKRKKDARAREAPSEVAPSLAARKKWPNGPTNGHATEDTLMTTKFTPAELERHKQTHKIYVKRETPAGDAWAEWTQKNTGHSQVWDAKGGWYFPSELPPQSPSEN